MTSGARRFCYRFAKFIGHFQIFFSQLYLIKGAKAAEGLWRREGSIWYLPLRNPFLDHVFTCSLYRLVPSSWGSVRWDSKFKRLRLEWWIQPDPSTIIERAHRSHESLSFLFWVLGSGAVILPRELHCFKGARHCSQTGTKDHCLSLAGYLDREVPVKKFILITWGLSQMFSAFEGLNPSNLFLSWFWTRC